MDPVEVITVIFAVLGVFSSIARVTPNDSDNAAIEWVWKFINTLGQHPGVEKE